MLITKIAAAVVLSLASFNPAVGVIFEAGDLEDIGTTYRYADARTGITTACTVVMDVNYLNEISDSLSRTRISISRETLKTFVLLHEIAHCYDEEQEPSGIDPVQWREYLADQFAATEMYAQGAINKAGYQHLLNMRRKFSRHIPSIPMAKSINMIDSEGFANSTVGRFHAARVFRRQHLRPGSISPVLLSE